jgi:hypothetical protein
VGGRPFSGERVGGSTPFSAREEENIDILGYFRHSKGGKMLNNSSKQPFGVV